MGGHRVFDMFNGKWEMTQIESNVPAQAFWRHVVSEYTDGCYIETYGDGRIKQSFDSCR